MSQCWIVTCARFRNTVWHSAYIYCNAVWRGLHDFAYLCGRMCTPLQYSCGTVCTIIEMRDVEASTKTRIHCKRCHATTASSSRTRPRSWEAAVQSKSNPVLRSLCALTWKFSVYPDMHILCTSMRRGVHLFCSFIRRSMYFLWIIFFFFLKKCGVVCTMLQYCGIVYTTLQCRVAQCAQLFAI